jgi:hypothetical protein
MIMKKWKSMGVVFGLALALAGGADARGRAVEWAVEWGRGVRSNPVPARQL